MKQENNKVFITGATGKIGKVLVRKLLDNGYQIRALVRDPGKIVANKNIEIIKGDICNRRAVLKGLEGCRYIIHLAAYQNASNENEDEFYRVNVEGTRILLDLMAKKKIDKFLYVSTVMVFKNTGRTPRDEGWDINFDEKTNLYVKSKVEALNLIKKYLKKIPTVILYPSVVIDPRDFISDNANMKGWQKLLSKTIGGGVPGGLMSLIGDKNRLINIILIDDLVEAMIRAMESGKGGETYIMGGRNISVDGYLNQVSKIKKAKKFPFRFPVFLFKFLSIFKVSKFNVFELIAKNPPQDLCFDCRKAQKDLGLKMTPLKDSVL